MRALDMLRGRPANQPEDGERDSLTAAFHRAIAFPASRSVEAGISPEQIRAHASEEAVFGRAALDERGLTAGMRLHALEPARRVLTAWREARAAFDRLLVPHMKDIDAIDRLDAEIADLHLRAEKEAAAREETLKADVKYGQIEQRFLRAESRYEEKFAENNQRVAITWGYTPSYVAAICCIGVAEWLINYDTFLLFTQIPAIAAGATIVLGGLLAFAAHGWGTLLRQWSHRFGRHRTSAERFGNWRLLALSTLGLLIVLGAAGGSRYAAGLRALANQPHFNILGAEAEIEVNLVRDVLLSLLANLAAFLVGVFLAYIAHDPDPDYMEAKHERERARRLYNRRRGRIDREIESIRARFGKQIAEKSNAARTRSRGVEEQRNLLLQVREHERAILTGVQAILRSTLERYRESLVILGLQQSPPLTFVRANDNQVLTAQQYKDSLLLIDVDFVKSLT